MPGDPMHLQVNILTGYIELELQNPLFQPSEPQHVPQRVSTAGPPTTFQGEGKVFRDPKHQTDPAPALVNTQQTHRVFKVRSERSISYHRK